METRRTKLWIFSFFLYIRLLELEKVYRQNDIMENNDGGIKRWIFVKDETGERFSLLSIENLQIGNSIRRFEKIENMKNMLLWGNLVSNMIYHFGLRRKSWVNVSITKLIHHDQKWFPRKIYGSSISLSLSHNSFLHFSSIHFPNT